MDDTGDCVLESAALAVASKTKPVLNAVKGKAFKPLFLALADLRMYAYHIKKYDGTTKQIINTIRFVEDKQWEVLGLTEVKEGIENSLELAKQYYPLANPTYLDEERKSNLFV